MPTQADKTTTPWQRLGSGVHSVVWRTRRIMQSSQDMTHEGTRVTDNESNPPDDFLNWMAVKVVYDNRAMPPHDIVREAVILRRLSHINVISILEFVRGGNDAPYALYMPLIPLSLPTLLSSPLFTPHPITGPYSALARPVLASSRDQGATSPFVVVAKSLIYQLILSISFLHSLDPPVAHRDINPANVLVDRDGIVKLIDFGIAWTHEGQRVQSEPTPAQKSSRGHRFDDWNETPESMCCQVATGPHRPPELLFSPPSYSAKAVDLWSLGTTIAQFFTPLRLNPSRTPLSSPSSSISEDIEEPMSSQFEISAGLREKIDYRAVWERQTLFDAERGELGLAWSIFRLRGTPNEQTWPSFNSLPDVSKVEFREASPKPLHKVLPHLPPSPTSEITTILSPVSLIDALLAYPPPSRLPAEQGLQHPWFSTDLLLPASHPGPEGTTHGKRSWITRWHSKTLGEWLEPVLERESSKVTQIDP